MRHAFYVELAEARGPVFPCVFFRFQADYLAIVVMHKLLPRVSFRKRTIPIRLKMKLLSAMDNGSYIPQTDGIAVRDRSNKPDILFCP